MPGAKSLGKVGASALLPIMIIFGLASAGMLAFSTLHRMRVAGLSTAFTKMVARQTARSAFVIMEAALQRRLWEMPPDAQCLKSTQFSVSGSTPDGANYTVEASYDPETTTVRLLSTGTFKGAKASAEKKIKTLDSTDFLVFSKGSAPTTLSRLYDQKAPVGYIGRNRKIYFEGPLHFFSVLERPTYPPDWNTPTPMVLPGELGTIIQGERFYFLKGVSYATYPMQLPNGEPYRSMFLTQGLNHYYQNGAGAAFFTSDHALAIQLDQDVRDGTMTGLPPFATLKKSIYPIALFCGARPLKAESGIDDGCYMNDPNQWLVIYHDYGGIANFGLRGDFTCLGRSDIPNPKRCSSSDDFPNGFRRWRRDAGLENIFYARDGVPISYPSINWDNLEALKEDAIACGLVTNTATLPGYQDCDISNTRIINDHLNGVSSCEQISKLDFETAPSLLNNFTPAHYSDPTLKNRLLRRIIYSNSPIELAQTAASGLATSLADPQVRSNLSLWMVNEDRYILKPMQPDLSSPLDSNPALRRALYFNQDPSGATPSLNLLLLSPEQVQIISPQHVPYLSVDLLQALPVVAGKIKPRNHIFTDSYHQENDGFKYGFRDIHIGNVTLITNALSLSGWYNNSGFNLRGLWSGGQDSSANQYVRNACMFSDPVGHVAVDPFSPAPASSYSWVPPSLPATPDSVVPPLGSRFYKPGNEVSSYFYPHVFTVQQAAMDTIVMNSRLFHTGIRILMNFDGSTPGGKRDLSARRHIASDFVAADLSDRRYIWTPSYYYQTTSGSTCGPAPIAGSGNIDGMTGLIQVNVDRTLYSQQSPPTTLPKMGSLFGVELPVVELAR
ncbi:MAG: hypothetical protein NDJ90_12445 [Oligoflexia bacterium]|nr:hypothetical protein [Oligoflexia bacterium]